MQRILITGAAGRLGKVLRGGLARSDRILRLLDIADLGEAATNEESKAENKYDTRGLEASYMAQAQSLRVSELKKDHYNLLRMALPENPAKEMKI